MLQKTLIERLLFQESLEQSSIDKIQPWGKFKPETVSGITPENQAKFFYKNTIMPYVEKSHDKFVEILNKMATPQCKVIHCIKSSRSFIDKAVRRGKDTSFMHDLSRGAIITDSAEDQQKVLNNLKNCGYVSEIDYKNKGECPTGYYGAHHVSVKVGGVHHEIQIMPKKLWYEKQRNHKLYKAST